ncbi:MULTISPECIES: KH domain-containing protein [unclassified Archaeoglobus]|jgi:ribosomal RNA assembly protein|uniref:KH domain-containing protein n=1 Tax=unclassified Archaeoglobus TaxID=2643606 RepID=UPI0025BD8978|nr:MULTISPECIES: KH domain-containing protein [unclassified Archaeoglobus]
MNVLEIEIPEDRIGALIGKEGEIKRLIEEKTGCKLRVSSKFGFVKVECEDALGFMRARDVVTAIAHGFSPEIALRLLDDEMLVLEVIDLSTIVSESAMRRIKGRIIGKEGKMRRQIEDMLNVNISIHGKHVAIIGEAENVAAAREAIMMLVDGAQHSTVIKFMERKRRELKSRSLEWL